MPELPEVETVVRQLRQHCIGKRIAAVQCDDTKVMDLSLKQAISEKIIAVDRKGKSIVFRLSSGKSLVGHLRMTGHFSITKIPPAYKVGTFTFDDGSVLHHHSIRKFGGMKLLTKSDYELYSSKIGPEPLGLSPQKFAKHMQQFPNAILKTKVMEQKVIAGIGNIYAQEALYRVGIHPQKKVGIVSKGKLEQFHKAMQEILTEAIKHNGTTVYSYGHITGKGNFQQLLQVYKKERCPKNHPIAKIIVGGRGTYYCPTCQRC